MSVKKALEKGFELVDKGAYKECIEHTSRALEIFKNDPDLLGLRGEANFKLEKHLEALGDLDKAAALEPENPFRYSSRAFLKDAMGDTKGAVEDYQMAYSLDPDDATILNNLGVLEEKLGYKEAAKRKFDLADELYKLDQENNPADQKKEQSALNPTSDEKSLDSHRTKVSKNYVQILSGIFTDKAQRREFLRFIKNGFKIK